MPATNPAPAKAPRQKRTDVLVTVLKITAPIDLTDAGSIPAATKAVDEALKGLPAAWTYTRTAGFGKV